MPNGLTALCGVMDGHKDCDGNVWALGEDDRHEFVIGRCTCDCHERAEAS